ncbi:hypothetical protein [Mangrovimonas sp. TPBH4]|uniref:hypothetical protein n=1 Tax=Mangrovimonas sp. TPBH4 TaxID=1645914 RepID=UPI0006B62713|nr:hypothetical protein [Mangrovimonas sp. TPBH4]
MDLTKHCHLCEHQSVSLKEGTSCTLTNRKPEFNRTCSKIELGDKFKTTLKSTNVELEKLKRNKTLTLIYFAVFTTIGLSVIIGGFLLGRYAWVSGVISPIPLVIMGVGLGPLGLAFGTLNRHNADFKLAKKHKDQIDNILELYKIEYAIDIKFGKEYHGTQDIEVQLNIKGVR